MLKIRLQRVGRKHDPSFRLVVTDSRKAPQGAYLEMLGSYDPRKDTKTIHTERIKHWLSVGAQVSDTAHNLLVSEKVIDNAKRDVASKKNVGKKAAQKAEADAKVAAESEKVTTVAEEQDEKMPSSDEEKTTEESEEKPADVSLAEEEVKTEAQKTE